MSLGQPMTSISIKDLIRISSTLKDLILPSFGPDSRPALLTSNTGQIVLTKDAHTIISSLCLPHPVAKCIVETVTSHSLVYGDGCKTLILYIYGALQAIETSFDVLAGDLKDISSKNGVSLSLHEFLNEDFPEIIKMSKDFLEEDLCRSDHLRPVLKTVLNGCLTDEIRDHLVNLLSDLILQLDFRSSGDGNMLNMCYLSCVHFLPNKSYLNSYITEGLYFQGVYTDQPPCKENMKFVFTLTPLGGETNSENEYSVVINSDNSENILRTRTRVAKDFIFRLQRAGVSLVITSQKVPDFVQNLYKEVAIVVVSCLDQEDLDMISYLTDKSPVTSIHDDLEDRNICCEASYQFVTVSGKRLLNLVCSSQHQKHKPRTLFLYAPTDGMCQQLKVTVRKCFKIARFLLLNHRDSICSGNEDFSSDIVNRCKSLHKSPVYESRPFDKFCNRVIGGGGYFEFLFSFLLELYSNKSVSMRKKRWAEVMQRMLLIIPQSLFNNLSSCQQNHCANFHRCHKEARVQIEQHLVYGFNSKGLLCNTFSFGIMDILGYKLATCYKALDLISKLLRVDSIVSVKHLPRDGSFESGSDEDLD